MTNRYPDIGISDAYTVSKSHCTNLFIVLSPKLWMGTVDLYNVVILQVFLFNFLQSNESLKFDGLNFRTVPAAAT